MKLTPKEKRVLGLMKKLDENQRRDLIAQLNGQIQANALTAKIARVKRVRTSPDHRVAQAYGLPRPSKRRGKKFP